MFYDWEKGVSEKFVDYNLKSLNVTLEDFLVLENSRDSFEPDEFLDLENFIRWIGNFLDPQSLKDCRK